MSVLMLVVLFITESYKEERCNDVEKFLNL